MTTWSYDTLRRLHRDPASSEVAATQLGQLVGRADGAPGGADVREGPAAGVDRGWGGDQGGVRGCDDR